MPHVLFFLPRPCFFVPEGWLRISAGLHEQHEVPVRHVVIVDREVRHPHFVRLKLVVPAELVSGASLQAQRRATRWNLHQVRLRSRRLPHRLLPPRNPPPSPKLLHHLPPRFPPHHPLPPPHSPHPPQPC